MSLVYFADHPQVRNLDPVARLLLMARVSIDRDTSSSIQRQLGPLHGFRDWTGRPLAGVAVDRSVSGAIDLPDRPQLGQWLNEKRDAWDVMVITTQDRLGRDDRHAMAFVNWLLDQGKLLIVLDDPGFDMFTPIGRWIIMGRAVQAAEELRKIRERCTLTALWMRNNKFWAGGNPSFGYLPERTGVDAEGKPRYLLAPEHEYGAYMADMADWVLEDDASTHDLARHFEGRGILTWLDFLNQRAGRPVKGYKWWPRAIGQLLTHPAAAGYVALKHEIYEDDSGEPLVFTPSPLLSPTRWRKVGAKLQSKRPPRINQPAKADTDKSLLSGVPLCFSCGGTIHYQGCYKPRVDGTTADYFYYRCTTSMNPDCTDRAAYKLTELDDLVEGALLNVAGHLQEVRKTVDPGEDHTEELAHLRNRLNRLGVRYAEGFYEGDEDGYERTHQTLMDKVKKIESLPVREAKPHYQLTGRTIAQKWKAMDNIAKRRFLEDTEVRIIVWRTGADGEQNGALVHIGNLRRLVELAGALPDDLPNPDAREWAAVNVSREQHVELLASGLLTKPLTRRARTKALARS
ncbi:recombinase family protein [Streptomyces sp. cg36]|uniref:recombinase family protein n=1 Tax=Streptomyces sp. cg36 TaxID=3238798 RepID=UPI0034E288D8